jgi:membrane AbrB-like protein
MAAALLGYAVAPLRIPNTWLLLPVLLGAIVAGLGFGPFEVPRFLVAAAQVVIGTWVGSRFKREIVGRLPRVTVSAIVVTFYLVIAAMGVAWLLTRLTDLSFTTAVLAVAPAGVVEMVLTATAMHLDAATVTAFQLMRIAVVMTTISFTFTAFEALTRPSNTERKTDTDDI